MNSYELIDKYIRENNITFELRAINDDGEVIVKQTSTISFDDVAAYAMLCDDMFEKIALESFEDRNEDFSSSSDE